MEKHAFHVWRYGRRCWCWQRAPPPSAVPPSVDGGGHRRLFPRQTVLAASFLVGLYALKSLSVCFPMSALTAAGTAVSLPLALAVNLCGTGVAQTIPFFLGRREQGDWRPWRSGFPGWRASAGPRRRTRGCPSFCCGWRGHRRGTW
ncbi:MAG: hypothetical protein ACLUIW_09085 [Dysosmobacter welbionis]